MTIFDLVIIRRRRYARSSTSCSDMDVEVEGAVVAERLRRRTTACDSTVEDGIGSVRDVAVEFVAGCVSGFAGIVVGQVRGCNDVNRDGSSG